MKRLLLATDGSEGANRACDVAAELARGLDASLVILTVLADSSDGQIERLARLEGDVGEALDLLANQTVDAAQRRARQAGATQLQTLTAWGDPAEAIISCALQQKVDAIVVGRRGRGRLSGLLLGSVSQKLVTLAPCPVIVVP